HDGADPPPAGADVPAPGYTEDHRSAARDAPRERQPALFARAALGSRDTVDARAAASGGCDNLTTPRPLWGGGGFPKGELAGKVTCCINGQGVAGHMIDLNAATLEELAALPGVGEALAYDLLLWRPYLSWEEVAHVPGFDRARV